MTRPKLALVPPEPRRRCDICGARYPHVEALMSDSEWLAHGFDRRRHEYSYRGELVVALVCLVAGLATIGYVLLFGGP